MENSFLRGRKTHPENLIKTKAKWRKIGPETENGFKNNWKALPREGFRIAILQSQNTL